MHQQVGIATDRRGEMTITAQSQAEMAAVFGAVIGLRLAAQNGLHRQLPLILIVNIGQHPIEQTRLDDLAQSQRLALRRHIFAQCDQFLAAGRLMVAIDHRRCLCFKRKRRSDIGRNHKVLDHSVRIEPLSDRDFFDCAFVVQAHLPFWQF